MWIDQIFNSNEINVLCNSSNSGTAFFGGIVVVVAAIRIDLSALSVSFVGTNIIARLNKINLVSSSSQYAGHSAFSFNENNVDVVDASFVRTSCPTKILVESNDVWMQVAPKSFFTPTSDVQSASIEPCACLIGAQTG